MLVLCWSTVYDAGPVLDQHWVNVSFFLGPTSRIHQPNVGPMLVHRLRRWPSIGPTCRVYWDMYGVEGCNVNHFPHTYEPGVVSDGKSAERPWVLTGLLFSRTPSITSGLQRFIVVWGAVTANATCTTMLLRCWPSVADVGPTLNQHCASLSEITCHILDHGKSQRA